MVVLRRSPSGPLEIVPTGPTGPIGPTGPTGPTGPIGPTGPVPEDIDGFDYVVRNRADLVAITPPVGGVFSLLSGGYAQKGNIDLEPGERIQTTAGRRVRWFGMQPAATIISGTATSSALFTVGSGSIVDFDAATIVNNDTAPTVLSAGTVTSRACYFTNNSTAAALSLIAATWAGSQNRYTSQNNYGISQTGGNWEDIASYISSTNASAIGGTTGGALTMRLVECTINGLQDGMQLAAPNLVAELIGCNVIFNTDSRQGIAVSGTHRSLYMSGGRITGTAAGTLRSGIHVAGNVTSLRAEGVRMDNMNIGLRRTAGTQGSALMADMDIEASVGIGVSWAAANMPTSGLILVGGHNRAATPWSGFTAADPLVNIKGVGGAAGLLTETGII